MVSKLLTTAAVGSLLALAGLPTQAQTILSAPPPPRLPTPSSIPTFAAPTLEMGTTGADVRLLQQVLTQRGFDPGPVDGAYGPLTRNAVATFQRASDLPVTGVAGPDTLNELGLYGSSGVAASPSDSTVTVAQRSNRSLRYVAAITESSRKLPRVQQVFRGATLDSARQGEFINIGRYGSYSDAADQVREARRRGFDARILYKP